MRRRPSVGAEASGASRGGVAPSQGPDAASAEGGRFERSGSRNNRAVEVLEGGQLDEAIELFEQVVSEAPENDTYRANLRNALLRHAGDSPGAIPMRRRPTTSARWSSLRTTRPASASRAARPREPSRPRRRTSSWNRRCTSPSASTGAGGDHRRGRRAQGHPGGRVPGVRRDLPQASGGGGRTAHRGGPLPLGGIQRGDGSRRLGRGRLRRDDPRPRRRPPRSGARARLRSCCATRSLTPSPPRSAARRCPRGSARGSRGGWRIRAPLGQGRPRARPPRRGRAAPVPLAELQGTLAGRTGRGSRAPTTRPSLSRTSWCRPTAATWSSR